MNTTYQLDERLDPYVTSQGWTHEIRILRDGEHLGSKLYRNLTNARADLVRRADLARKGGNAGNVIIDDRTL